MNERILKEEVLKGELLKTALYYAMRIVKVRSTEQYGIKGGRIPFEPNFISYKWNIVLYR
ncbi:hypothetical protein DWX49_04890 [Blautia sp. AF19-34]|nr:hypothetical protein DWX49_04890 [Blautia sp. AF19-34]